MVLFVGVRILAAPMVTPFPEYVADEGALYVAAIRLDEWVEDALYADEDLAWSFPAGTALRLALTPDRHLVVRPPNPDWQGLETIALTVCNPAGACATATASFRVENTPDAPVIEWIPDQVTSEGTAFAPLDLGPYGWDPDGDDVVWEARGGPVLTAAVVDGVLHVQAPGGWSGREDVRLELRDPSGRRATRSVGCVVSAEELPVVITALGVEGIVIECGDVKVLIDALVRDALPLTSSERERLQRAAPPYDGVTLALTTHPHYDHFDAGYAAQFLTHASSAVFVSVGETVDALRRERGWSAIADRVLEIAFSPGTRTELDLAGVRVTAFHLEHTGPGGLPNLAYLIDVGGVRILHLGDATETWPAADLIAWFGWPSLGIDVLLGSLRWVAASPDTSLLARAVAPRYVIPIHFGGLCPPSQMSYTLGDATLTLLCAKGASWIVPPRTRGGGSP
ncbi:MAG: MBL fold metallo-hydrolase [Candidatus Bipolaricaulis sp.]|nr:MBL fold metallo-hydrolase [Candidatus Bipolaricaulis sp.]